MLQSAVRARARSSPSSATARGADPKGPQQAPSPQPTSAQAERPGIRAAPRGRAHGSAGGLRWESRSLCVSPGQSPVPGRTSEPDGFWGLGSPGRAGRDSEAPGATQSGQRGRGVRPQPGSGGGAPRSPGSSLKVSRERPPSRPATSAGGRAGGRLCARDSRGPGQAVARAPREPPCSARALGRSSSAPAPRQVRVCARSSSATASCAWCGLSGW